MARKPAPESEPDETDQTGRDDSTMIAARSKVWFYDDDGTPVDFVMYALEHFFGLDEAKAAEAVERIRAQGKAMVLEMPAIPAEIAKRRLQQALDDAGYPLKIEIEGQQIV